MLKINNTTTPTKNNNNVNFKGANTLNGITKVADVFLKSQENLSSTRFIQDTATNWFPKAIVSRSKEDFAEMSFLEFLESGIFYFALPIFGEKLFRNGVFKNLIPKNIRNTVNEQLPKTIKEISQNKNLTKEVKDSAIATKAGILLACSLIPVAEFTLSFAKNYFTLKTFKKSNFDNIAKLDKNNKIEEDKSQQEKVEKNAIKHFKIAGAISALGIGAGILLATKGKNTKTGQKISKAILEPGKTLNNFLTNKKLKSKDSLKFLNSISLDFENNKGKLALSKGQLGLTAIIGLFGYSKAAEDRGKLDKKEVWTRVPLVVFYTIFGSELFEKGFSKLLSKKNAFPDLIKKGNDGKLIIPTRDELPKIAAKLAQQNKTTANSELSKLTKQKALISAIPYAFSLLFMGFSLSLLTRIFTQYRYNKDHKTENKNLETGLVFGKNVADFKNFIKQNNWLPIILVV